MNWVSYLFFSDILLEVSSDVRIFFLQLQFVLEEGCGVYMVDMFWKRSP